MNAHAPSLLFEGAHRPRLVVGLLNNMPDSALAATERQFAGLLREAGGAAEVELRLFALPGIERGERAQAQMAGRYEDARGLPDAGLDGLIVTGAEPKAADLDQEPYWPALARVIDWTQAAAIPTVWSCLAAHAAVLRLDGVRRRPLPAKLSGVFTSRRIGDDALLIGAGDGLPTPHSRQNGLDEEELVFHGYEILARSPDVGVDSFVRRGSAPALFLQGHPEYDADTLMREYCRDMGRFMRGERPARPAAPAGYFDRATQNDLADLARDADALGQPAFIDRQADILSRATPQTTWRDTALLIYRNWLHEVAEQRVVARPAMVMAR